MSLACKDCEKRYPGCHDKCQTYQEWKTDRERFLDDIHKQKVINDVLTLNTEQRCRRRSEDNRLNKYRESKRKVKNV